MGIAGRGNKAVVHHRPRALKPIQGRTWPRKIQMVRGHGLRVGVPAFPEHGQPGQRIGVRVQPDRRDEVQIVAHSEAPYRGLVGGEYGCRRQCRLLHDFHTPLPEWVPRERGKFFHGHV